MSADGSVTLDMSVDTEKVTKAITKLEDLLEQFGGNGAKNVKEIGDAIDKIEENAKNLKIEPTTEGMTRAVDDLDNLNARIDNQRYTLQNLKEEYAKVADEFGEGSDEALKLEKQILNLENAMQKNIRKSDDMADSLGEMEDAMSDLEKASEDTAKSVDDTGKTTKGVHGVFQKGATFIKSFSSALKGVPEDADKTTKGVSAMDVSLGNLVSNGISKAISAIGDLLDKTAEYRQDMSKLNENANQAGVSLDVTSDAMRRLNAITGETDSNVEAVSNLLAAGFKDNALLDAVDALSGAVIKFPDTMKIESLADSLQETIATGEATGQFSELLGRLGVNVESFSKHISRLSEEQRANYAVLLLQHYGLDDINESYRENNKTLIDSANAQYDLNEAMSQVAAVIEPIKSKLLIQLSKALEDNQGAIEGVVNFIGSLVSALLSIPTPVYAVIAVVVALIAVIKMITGVVTTVQLVMTAFTTAMSAVAPVATAAGAGLAPLALEIMLIVAAVALAVAAIAMLISVIGQLSGKKVKMDVDIKTPDIPTVDELKRQQRGKGYASGTKSAASGYAWVGENGPELVKFNGGEEVLNANQSLAKRFSGNGRQTIYNENTTNVFKVDDIKTYQRIESRMKRERISKRMGYVGVK